MIATEKQVKMAARMYEMRDTAKRLLGDGYAPHMTKIGSMLQARADSIGGTVLSAAIEACKQPNVGPMDTVMIMAAAVEMTEPL